MSSLYSMYVLEKEGKETLEIPNKGFITYKRVGDLCHIYILYIHPNYRDAKLARDLVRAIADKFGNDIKGISAVCYTKQENTTNTMKILLHYGFEIVGTDKDDILLYKELR